MSRSDRPHVEKPARAARRSRIGLTALGLAAVASLGVSFVGLALAASKAAAPTLGSAHNAMLGKTIVVDNKGLTVYRLAPETATSLLCTQASGCLNVWFPVTVPSKQTKLKAGSGVKGRLGVFHRNDDGKFQVTLDGQPLYTFLLDHMQPGVATGDKIPSFGGVWHVLPATTATKHGGRTHHRPRHHTPTHHHNPTPKPTPTPTPY